MSFKKKRGVGKEKKRREKRSQPAMPSSVSQVTAVGEVQGPRIGPKPNRNLREKRRLTQFNFESPSPFETPTPCLDLLEVVKTLSAESRSHRIRSSDACCEVGQVQSADEDDEDYGGIMTTTSDEEEEDSCSEIGAEDIILKWVV